MDKMGNLCLIKCYSAMQNQKALHMNQFTCKVSRYCFLALHGGVLRFAVIKSPYHESCTNSSCTILLCETHIDLYANTLKNNAEYKMKAVFRETDDFKS